MFAPTPPPLQRPCVPGREPGPVSVATSATAELVEARPRWRGVIHQAGFVVVAVGGPLTVGLAPVTAGERAALAVYVGAFMALFAISSRLHRGVWSGRSKRLLRRVDHSLIYVAIAGTYTPLLVLAFPPEESRILLMVVWGVAAVGIALKWLPFGLARTICGVPYVILGWIVVVRYPTFAAVTTAPEATLILAGGIVFTLGALVLALRWPDPVPDVFGYHEVFHAATAVGAVAQYLALVSLAWG